MKIIIQRVNFAKIFVNNEFKGEIQKGIVAYVGVANGDCEEDIDFCIDKLINLRIFNDENGKLNLSVKDIKGELLIVSNFTIYGNTKKEEDQATQILQKLTKLKRSITFFYKN